MPGARCEERCTAMRCMARSYEAMGDMRAAQIMLLRACAEAPHMREPWCDAATLARRCGEWEGVIYFCRKALEIRPSGREYMREPEAWGSLPYDLISLGYYYTDRPEMAVAAVKEAIKRSPPDGRLYENLDIMTEAQRRAELLRGR